MSRSSTVNQAMVYLLILILGFPILIRSTSAWSNIFGVTLSFSGVCVIIYGLVLFLKQWEQRNKKSYTLAPYYINLMTFYTLAYTFAVVVSPDGNFLSGLHPIFNNDETYVTASLNSIYHNILMLIIDALYYSIVIMTTLGDGSIQPRGILKLVLISHVGFTVYITVFGVAEYFANESSKELKSEVEKLKRELHRKNVSFIASEKIIPLSKRLYFCFRVLLTGKCT